MGLKKKTGTMPYMEVAVQRRARGGVGWGRGEGEEEGAAAAASTLAGA